MKYAVNLAGAQSSQGLSLIEAGQTRASVASECRTTALDFMAGVADGWTKFDLALWLHGPYALAARHSQTGERPASMPPRSGPRRNAVPEKMIERLLVQTRSHLLASLELAVLVNGRLDFIESALIEGHVCRATDDAGESIWVPVDVARMRLRDRVASLFAADYLNASDDYHHLYVCHHCEAVVFEEGARERGMCGAHRMSGIVSKRATMAYCDSSE